jgi:hypothetical protein
LITTELLFSYLPSAHGEHGIDATLHRLAKNNDKMHEVFSNPPGGSWTAFDIQRPDTNEVFRWDHMPRVPAAKRPDFVLQFNEGEIINFIVMESKQTIQDAYPNMGPSMIKFFTGTGSYLGLKNRPAWHRKENDQVQWKLIPPDSENNTRYWFRDWPEAQVRYWPAFSFARYPEWSLEISKSQIINLSNQLSQMLKTHADLSIAVLIGWLGPYHMPFAVRSFSEEFRHSPVSQIFDEFLQPIILPF